MTLATAALAFVVDTALGAWLGAMAFFSFVAAPRIFAVLDGRAGDVVSDIFPRYYVLGVALGSAAFLAVLLDGFLADFDLLCGLLFLAIGLPVALSAYARWVLLPRMDEAGADAFSAYHRRSVVLNGVAMASVLAGLVVSHL